MISVVIPAFNEEKSIADCLSSIAAQESSEPFEVIVVDNNSTDSTKKIAESFKSKIRNYKVVSEKTKGAGPARAKGFGMAKGDIFLSTDSDSVLPADWVAKLSKGLEDKSVAAVTGTCRINDLSGFKNAIFNTFQPLAMRAYRLMFGHYWLSGFNYGIRKQAYLRAGGINTKMKFLDDIELSFKVSKIGRIKFIPNCPVLTSGRRFKNGLLKGMFSYLHNFTKYFLMKKGNVSFDDVR